MFEMLQAIDGNVLLWIQDVLRTDVLSPLLVFYTGLGDTGLLWLIISAVMVLFRPTRKAGIVTFVAVGFGALFTNVMIKPLVVRPRPYLMVEGLIALVTSNDPNSFPSGHTTAAFAAGLVWYKMLDRDWMRRLGLFSAFLMGFSRLYVGVHYPTDVLAGMILGTVAGVIACQVCEGLFERYPRLG